MKYLFLFLFQESFGKESELALSQPASQPVSQLAIQLGFVQRRPALLKVLYILIEF